MAYNESNYVSMEQELEKDRKEVMEVLQALPPTARQRGSSTSSLSPTPHTFPLSPVRSMLDVGDELGPVPRHASLPENRTRVDTPPQGVVRSMLDIDASPPDPSLSSPLLSRSSQARSTHVSPQGHASSSTHHHRSQSDASANSSETSRNPNSSNRRSGFLSGGNLSLSKRSAQGGRKALPSALGEALRGELSGFGPKVRSKRRSNSVVSQSSNGGDIVGRSDSPLGLSPNKVILDDGQVIDKSKAYRRLSDAALAMSGGALSSLGRTKRSGTNEDQRLRKDYTLPDGEPALVDSSDEESSEEGHGRKYIERDTKAGKVPFSPRNLLEAAEEERRTVSAKPMANSNYKSLLDPEITVTAPHGHKGTSVHPHTSFDQPVFQTPHDSENEAQVSDIKRAQKMAISMTPILASPATSRCVRTLYRGDFAQMQEEARDHQRRIRKYLVATDLSDEAAHALEWTIGTVLRDGDTLLAFYCVDEEFGISPNEVPNIDSQMREQVAAIADSTRVAGSTPVVAGSTNPNLILSNIRHDSLSPGSTSASTMGRGSNRKEQEQQRAIHDITERVAKLLRKTKLQVKVVIEVISCKSPKHLICEVIDFINPTLVVLGSRGRSALKGVILGSFSNYIVTKSSVPVMVARKKLKKHTKYKRPSTLKLANNLNNAFGVANMERTLARAKID